MKSPQPPGDAQPAPAPHAAAPRKPLRVGLVFVIPLLAFGALALVLGIGLSLDPREVPSPLIGKDVPRFELPPVKGRTMGLATRDLTGEVSLVNVFASWCVACREEHPVLVALARRRLVPIHGLNHKDKPEDAAVWLDRWGDPYTRIGADIDGRVGIDWGVYGVPETFVIDPQGRIAYKHIGPMTEEFVRVKLLPMIERLRSQSPSPRGSAPAPRSSSAGLDG